MTLLETGIRSTVALALAYVAFEILMLGGTTQITPLNTDSGPATSDPPLNPDTGRAPSLGGPDADTGESQDPMPHQIAATEPPLTA